MIDRAEYGPGAECFDEGTGAVVDGFPGNAHVVGIHHAVNETDPHPAGDQGCLPIHDGMQEVEIA